MNLERDTSIGKLQLTRHNEQNMGIKDLIMSMLGSKKEEHTGPVGSDEAVENYSQFVEAKEELSKSILNELSSEDEQPDQPPETIIVSEYDVGEAELESLNNEDDNENFNEKNVVLHESVEDITDPLTDAKVIGDLPEEVEF